MIALALSLWPRSLHYCHNQENAVDHRKQNERQHHVYDLYVMKDGDKHRRKQNQVNDNEDRKLLLWHSQFARSP